MIPVHIFWTKPFGANGKRLESCMMMLLSSLMLKRLYKEVHVITDNYGKEVIERLGLPYDKIHLGLNEADTNYDFPAAKVLAYKKLADVVPNFLHVDFDVFMLDPVIDKPFIVQADEGVNPYVNSVYNYLKLKGVQFDFEYHSDDLRFLNMGLFRCSDKGIVYDYYESFFSSLYANQHLYDKDFLMFEWLMFMEQNYIYKIFQKHGVTTKIHQHYHRSLPSYNNFEAVENKNVGIIIDKYMDRSLRYDNWYDSPANIEKIEDTRYVHLIHYKGVEKVLSSTFQYAITHFPLAVSDLLTKYKTL